MKIKDGQLIQAATTIHATETELETIDVAYYDTLVLCVTYAKGDETGVYIVPYFLDIAGGSAYQYCTWSADAASTVTARKFYLTASGSHYIVLDVDGCSHVTIKDDANGGTPSGTLAMKYTATRKS